MSKNQRIRSGKLGLAKTMRSDPTEAEAALWNELRSKKLGGYKFRRQQPIFGYIADFYCEAADLCVELDGDVHLLPDQAEWDRDREQAMAQAGILTVRFKNRQVLEDLPTFLTQLLKVLETRRKPTQEPEASINEEN